MSGNRVSGVAMALWLAVQVGALALSAFRVPLAIGLPPAAEQSALYILLIAQVGGAALLALPLFNFRRNVIFATAAAWPIGELAGLLADASTGRVLLCEFYVTAWILTLAVWVWAVGKMRLAPILPAAAGAISLGGPVLWYLHAEFVTQSDKINWPRAALLGPVMGALSQAVANPPPFSAWWIFVALIPIGSLIGAVAHKTIAKKNAGARDFVETS
jgi:hypothetical protein